jgi:outer membrane protein assembly factor BamE (lipoprotein component of BamABCDE complex)
MLDPEICSQITPGVTTREEVATKLGTPTSISTFNENAWYYIGRETEQYSFLSPVVLKQQAVEIDFDDKGIVTALTNLDLSQAADASPVDRATPTFGQKNSFLRELLGDMSHPRPDLGKQNRGSGT